MSTFNSKNAQNKKFNIRRYAASDDTMTMIYSKSGTGHSMYDADPEYMSVRDASYNIADHYLNG